MEGMNSKKSEKKEDANGLDALRMSAHKFYSDSKPVSSRPQTSKKTLSMKNIRPSTSYRPFKFSEQNFRSSFFDKLQAPNSNRFIKFNDISDKNSKYLIQKKSDFSKVVDRDKPIVGVYKTEVTEAEYEINSTDI